MPGSRHIFRLDLFGGCWLKDGGTPVPGRAAQRRRLACLAAIAVSGRGGVGRDKLLALLWPERDTDSARHLLADTLWVLRSTLGDDAILTPGDLVSLNPDVVRCDVHAFEDALGRKDLPAAVALYAGPFLDGFHIGDSPEFERWMDGERGRLEALCAEVLETLARDADRGGELAAAVSWWRRLAALRPYDTAVARQLVEALLEAGNRAGAIQHVRVHITMLRDLDLEPDPGLIELAQSLQAGRGSAAAPTPETEPPTDPSMAQGAARPGGVSSDSDRAGFGPDPGHVSPSADPRRRERRGRAGRAALGIAGLPVLGLAAMLLLAAGVLYLLAGRTAAYDSRRVVVDVFENRTGEPALSAIGTMAADWVVHGLQRLGSADVVPLSLVHSTLRGPGARAPGSTPAGHTSVLGAEFRARIVIRGAYYLEGDSLRFIAEVTDVRNRRLLHATAPVMASRDAPAAGLDILTREIVEFMNVWGGLTTAGLEIALAQLSWLPSLEAYQEFAVGLDLLIGRNDDRAALRHFDRALAIDSTFVDALFHAAIVHLNAGEFAAAEPYIERLAGWVHRLTPFDRARLDYLTAASRGDLAGGLQAARTMVERLPGAGTGHYGVALHANWLNRPREAAAALRRVPRQSLYRQQVRYYWVQYANAWHLLGRHRRELRVLRQARDLQPHDPLLLQLEFEAMAASGLHTEIVARLEELLAKEDPTHALYAVALELDAHGNASAARNLVQRLTEWIEARHPRGEPDASEPMPAARMRVHALALAWLGRDEEARAILEDLVREHPEEWTDRARLGWVAARMGDLEKAEEISAWLAWLDRPRPLGAHRYFQASIAAELGDVDRAIALLHEAYAQGFQHTRDIEREPAFRTLREHPGFRELMRPKG